MQAPVQRLHLQSEGDGGLSPPPQAPSEAEAAPDLIDMGPDPVATGSLSSQLAEMSKCSPGGSGQGTSPTMGALSLHSWGWSAHSRMSAQPPPPRGPLLNLAVGLASSCTAGIKHGRFSLPAP